MIDVEPEGAADLVRLVYISVAVGRLTIDDLAAIEAGSTRNNAARQLTGLLLFGEGRFYGLLEGQERRVFARMERIITDPRHRSLCILREDRVLERRFADWSFSRMPDADDARGDPLALDRFLLGLTVATSP